MNLKAIGAQPHGALNRVDIAAENRQLFVLMHVKAVRVDFDGLVGVGLARRRKAALRRRVNRPQAHHGGQQHSGQPQVQRLQVRSLF